MARSRTRFSLIGVSLKSKSDWLRTAIRGENRFVVDPPLEGTGFERTPRGMGRSKSGRPAQNTGAARLAFLCRHLVEPKQLQRLGRTIIDGIRPRKLGSHWTLRWREPDSNHRSRSCEWLFWALPIADGSTKAEPLTGSGPSRQCLPGVAPHSLFLRGGTASSSPSSSTDESATNRLLNRPPMGDSRAKTQDSNRRFPTKWTLEAIYNHGAPGHSALRSRGPEAMFLCDLLTSPKTDHAP